MAEITTERLLNVLATARTRGVSGEVVLEGYRRAVDYWTARDTSSLEDIESLPPGLLDIRILDQDLIWIDVLRTAHTITDRTEVTDDYLTNIIGWLQHFARHSRKYQRGFTVRNYQSALCSGWKGQRFFAASGEKSVIEGSSILTTTGLRLAG